MADLVSNTAVRLLGFLILVVLAIFQLRIALLEQNEFSKQKVTDPLSAYQYNPRMLTWHAERQLMIEDGLDTTKALYQQALTANPLYIPAWLGLAELEQLRGDKKTANAILDLVDQYTRAIKRWHWEKVQIAYQLQRKDILAGALAYIIKEIPGKTNEDALRMAFSLWKNPAELMDTMGRDNAVTLFRYAIRTKKIDEAIALWPAIREQGLANQQQEVLAFLEMLITMDHLPLAMDIWKHSFNQQTLFFNGDFTTLPLQAAFDWRISAIKGSDWRIEAKSQDQATPALHIHFNHQENCNFQNAYQIIPLKGGREYRLQVRWKSQNLTTDQRPFVEVYGYQCKADPVATRMIGANQEWQDLALNFTVPEECAAMVVRIRRNPSAYFDNQLGGDIWLTGFDISAPGTARKSSLDVEP